MAVILFAEYGDWGWRIHRRLEDGVGRQGSVDFVAYYEDAISRINEQHDQPYEFFIIGDVQSKNGKNGILIPTISLLDEIIRRNIGYYRVAVVSDNPAVKMAAQQRGIKSYSKGIAGEKDDLTHLVWDVGRRFARQ